MTGFLTAGSSSMTLRAACSESGAEDDDAEAGVVRGEGSSWEMDDVGGRQSFEIAEMIRQDSLFVRCPAVGELS